MITLSWVYIGLMVGSALAVISITIVDLFNAHNDLYSDERHRPFNANPVHEHNDERVRASKFRLPDQVSKLNKEKVLVWQTHPKHPASPLHRQKLNRPGTKTSGSKSFVAHTNFMNHEDGRMGTT
jgi:hypothetical protein